MTVYCLINNSPTVQAAPALLVHPANPGGVASQSAALQVVVNGTGSCSATVELLATNDGLNMLNMGTVVVTAANAGVVPGNGSLVVANVPFDKFGAIVTAVSGTNANVTALLSA